MALYLYPLDYQDPALAFAPLAFNSHALFLDSADHSHSAGRYSFFCSDPVQIFTLNKSWPDLVKDLRAALAEFHIGETAQSPVPFCGGLAGYLSYDLGRQFEDLPQKAKFDPGLPDLVLGLYDCVAVYDHVDKQAQLCVNAHTQGEANQKHDAFMDRLRSGNAYGKGNRVIQDWHSDFRRETFEAAIQKTVDYIYAGDIFQANMAQRFYASVPENFDAWAHYLYLRTINAAPFASWFHSPDIHLSSASPERFLQLSSSGKVETRPIKGTSPRLSDPKLDQLQRETLQSSIKDRAENAMIVDLMRNDLARVCEDDSIKVPSLFNLESFANVHHLVSTVTGQIKKGTDAFDVIAATFPGGSITGAPKIRAMEIIEELEPIRRGPYCGSIGYIGFDGAMDLNIAIRTILFRAGEAYFYAGSGIVADSVPPSEYEETLHKADRLFRSFHPA